MYTILHMMGSKSLLVFANSPACMHYLSSATNSEVYNPPTYLFSLYMYMEEDLCREVVYFTVMLDHPNLVSVLFTVLVSLRPVTFLNVFYYFSI